MRARHTSSARQLGVALIIGGALAACSHSDRGTTDSASGGIASQTAERATTVDTGLANAATPVAGGTAQITPTDEKSVRKATEYKLTETNFKQFVAASDSLAALRARDPQVRAMFDKQVNDAGAGVATRTNNAGRARLEDNPAIANAITSTGMSVKDYFVASIAVAQAERFMGDPKAAIPTPALPGNAEFLRGHQAELAHLKSLGGH
jgi:hypothetical protein